VDEKLVQQVEEERCKRCGHTFGFHWKYKQQCGWASFCSCREFKGEAVEIEEDNE
jgi:ribosomal protein L37E